MEYYSDMVEQSPQNVNVPAVVQGAAPDDLWGSYVTLGRAIGAEVVYTVSAGSNEAIVVTEAVPSGPSVGYRDFQDYAIEQSANPQGSSGRRAAAAVAFKQLLEAGKRQAAGQLDKLPRLRVEPPFSAETQETNAPPPAHRVDAASLKAMVEVIVKDTTDLSAAGAQSRYYGTIAEKLGPAAVITWLAVAERALQKEKAPPSNGG